MMKCTYAIVACKIIEKVLLSQLVPDLPELSQLISGWWNIKTLHVVYSRDKIENFCFLIQF